MFDKENEACLCRESESQEIVETYKRAPQDQSQVQLVVRRLARATACELGLLLIT